ncbi:heparan sulfate 2-O-sulfotransferase 1-like isoform X1 [Pomacea canaliculata]|uniref:heparan sulfate 2-O-sulfotransferase 1-like isoform X1 n=2 Tax=Pomacea canaliculata TaxID=400727 RepID=UPI000D73BE39|nr:heparan sulfate 2-O-sulfotransferase 1-like isoform X1 [Pomacea canaliculata]
MCFDKGFMAMKVKLAKLRYFVGGLSAICMIATCICFYLFAEIISLDETRVRLEMTVAKLQHDKLYMTRRQLAAADDLDGVDFGDDDTVVIYNRIPKTGSTTLAGIMYALCFVNKYFVIHVGMMDRAKTIALSDQMKFMQNITNWQEKKPALYHGHMAFIDYTKFGVKKKPIYINIIRNPLDRLVSFYYFTRYGDDIRPSKERMKERTRETFDECVQRRGEDCDPVNLWLQIPYFCGHVAECWIPGNEWALKRAKQNVLQRYLVVGATEEMEDFVLVLEVLLPRFFKADQKFTKVGKVLT